MKNQLPMYSKLPDPIVVPARTAVLLVFMPPATAGNQQRSSLIAFANVLQNLVGESVRVLKIDEVTHPEVVQSFKVTFVPTFVFVQEGVELWRQMGITDAVFLAKRVNYQLMN
ncbi:hypothetical protein GCM10027592_52920 [Spirosoma flavus]